MWSAGAGEEGLRRPDVLYGEGRAAPPPGSRWAGRNHGSRFPLSNCNVCGTIMKYYSRKSSVPLPGSGEREVKHERSGIGGGQASGAWESLGGLEPVCPQRDQGLFRSHPHAGTGTRLACPGQPPSHHSAVSSPKRAGRVLSATAREPRQLARGWESQLGKLTQRRITGLPATLLPARRAPHAQRARLWSSVPGHPLEGGSTVPLVNPEAGPYMLVALILKAPWEVVVSVP